MCICLGCPIIIVFIKRKIKYKGGVAMYIEYSIQFILRGYRDNILVSS